MHWSQNAVFYHIYPLGALGAPEKKDSTEITHRLPELMTWTDHLLQLGVNAVYLGPVWDSESHGYDTTDYRKVDPRLGSNEDLRELVQFWKSKGIRTVIDGVFNHTGRSFFAFDDIRKNKNQSPYINWYRIDASGNNHYGDGFSYQSWEGHSHLPSLNLENREVITYLLESVEFWISEFGIEGIRLDAADCLSQVFNKELRMCTRKISESFWLMGELIHGDYRNWVSDDMYHSCTNYEIYKGLYSSHNDSNYFELAYSLNRLFGKDGLYKDKNLYNFCDNHDVNRIASNLTVSSNLYPLMGLLFTIPGIPSIYYGSENGIAGKRTEYSDKELRPRLNLKDLQNGPHAPLISVISTLATIRKQYKALQAGSYRQLGLSHTFIAFMREYENQHIVVIANSAPHKQEINLKGISGHWKDLLTNEEMDIPENGNIVLYPDWLRILVRC